MVEYLLDSNPVIDFLNGTLSVGGRNFVSVVEPAISVITHIELLSNKNIPLKEWVQLQAFIKIAVIYPLDSDIVDYTILLRQDFKIKTPDAIIAATALVGGLTLITRNVSDFRSIPGLNIIDPHTL